MGVQSFRYAIGVEMYDSQAIIGHISTNEK